MSLPPKTLNPAPAIPDHQLIRLIARGGYGEVWLARSVMGTFRAVKIVYRVSFDHDRPYEREFNGVQKFEPISRTHPGLVNLLHIGRNDEAGYFYCVMEAADDLAGGQAIPAESYRPRTLASEIAGRGRLPFDDCLKLGIALADALGHLHSRGLVHRDIKPSNIIFVAGVPKLADIGLVTQIGTQATFVGTEGYLAPEGPGSPTADLYALGKVIYEISMGKAQDHFPELPTRLRELPEAAELMRLNAIVLKACDPQSAKRFQTAGELSGALAELRPKLSASARENGTLKGLKAVLLAYTPADRLVAGNIIEQCEAEGLILVHDQEPVLGVEWARRLEQQIRTADFVIPIISAASMRNELMAYSLEIASHATSLASKAARLLPVCLDLKEALPRQISVALEGALAPIYGSSVSFASAVPKLALGEEVIRSLRAALSL